MGEEDRRVPGWLADPRPDYLENGERCDFAPATRHECQCERLPADFTVPTLDHARACPTRHEEPDEEGDVIRENPLFFAYWLQREVGAVGDDVDLDALWAQYAEDQAEVIATRRDLASPTRQKYVPRDGERIAPANEVRKVAQAIWGDDDLYVSPDAEVTPTDHGYWIDARVYVSEAEYQATMAGS